MVDFKLLADGLAFPEGPTLLPDGDLAVVEIAAGTITRIGKGGRKSTIATPGAGPNGMAVGPDGALYLCNNGGFAWKREEDGRLVPDGQPENYSGGRIERVDIETGRVEPLYTHCDGHALRGPNDIVFDNHGRFYFTDHGKRRSRDLDFGGLYYARADGSEIRELAHQMILPNGVGLSSEGRELYVAETRTGHLWAFPITAPGVIAKSPPHMNGGRHLAGPAAYTSFDSLAVEGGGNICVAALVIGGIHVIAPNGDAVEFIAAPEPYCTNICFAGDDMRTAIVTLSSTGQLVSLPWPRPGLLLNAWAGNSG